MMLHEIYDKIMDVHEYYRTSKNEAWRNAVRHNLSVNECFIKVGKADTGRGWVQTWLEKNIWTTKKKILIQGFNEEIIEILWLAASDPGFPKGGEGTNLLLFGKLFAKSCMKMKEIGPYS